MNEDSCVKPADMQAMRELMDHRIDALADKVELHVAALKDMIRKSAEEATEKHAHLEQLVNLAKEEGGKAREKIDVDLRTLREGRSTDKGRALGQEPWLKLMMGLLALILGAALLAYLAGRGSNAPAPAPTTNGARP